MKTETMTSQWVVENFLPDFQERYRDYYEVDIDDDLSPDYELEYPDWINKHFPEALSELLKAQRAVCAERADYHSYLRVKSTPIPEPKNRK